MFCVPCRKDVQEQERLLTRQPVKPIPPTASLKTKQAQQSLKQNYWDYFPAPTEYLKDIKSGYLGVII